MEIYATAREFMARTGNPHQWGDSGHPSAEMIKQDLEIGHLYVIEDDSCVQAVFMFTLIPDPTYLYIEDGNWPNNEPYGTIHRIAGSGQIKGVLSLAVDYAKQYINNIRIDTHEDNKVMQCALSKKGFKRCGIIYLENGDPRIAYQLVSD